MASFREDSIALETLVGSLVRTPFSTAHGIVYKVVDALKGGTEKSYK